VTATDSSDQSGVQPIGQLIRAVLAPVRDSADGSACPGSCTPIRRSELVVQANQDEGHHRHRNTADPRDRPLTLSCLTPAACVIQPRTRSIRFPALIELSSESVEPQDEHLPLIAPDQIPRASDKAFPPFCTCLHLSMIDAAAAIMTMDRAPIVFLEQ
jgi:hypothetical protein